MKLSINWFGALMMLLWFTPAYAQSTQPPRDDKQFWNETQLIKPLSKDKDLIVIAVLRVGREFRRPVDERIGIAVAFKPNKYLTVTPSYAYVDQQPFAGRRVSEHRILFTVTGKLTLGKFTFTDRNQFEGRVRHESPDFIMYRNRLQIDHPARLGAFEFKPFILDEIFYSTQERQSGERQGWFRNRISAGIIKQFSERFNAEFFYLYQHDGVSNPGNVHAIGTLFRIYLN